MLSPEACYEAVASRDRRFDGRFFTAVRTTGVYCRPGCPARTPGRRNVRFYASAPAAETAGYRPCKRCRPDAAPGTPIGATSEVVARALAAINAGALDTEKLATLAARLGVTERHLRRLFRDELGTSPAALALTRRVHFARTLLATDLPITRVALAAGFQSIRAFNEAFRRSFGESPSRLRRHAAEPERIRLELAYRTPLAWRPLLEFLAARAIPGVERVVGDEYSRSFDRGVLTVRPRREGCLELDVPASAAPELLSLVARIRRLLDLDADPLAVATHLARDPELARRIRACPGLRVPGAFDAFELGVRAILGQQISVARATRLAGKVVELWGRGEGEWRLFPRPEALAVAEVERAGMPRARAQAIRGFAAAVASGELALVPGMSLEEAARRLTAIRGIGPWTASYMALRALGEPDAFPASDLGLRKALASSGELPSVREMEARAARWRPWRAYAALYLWSVP